MSVVIGVAALLVSTAGPIYAGVATAVTPEIDPSSILAGLGLLGAGVMLLRARRRSK